MSFINNWINSFAVKMQQLLQKLLHYLQRQWEFTYYFINIKILVKQLSHLNITIQVQNRLKLNMDDIDYSNYLVANFIKLYLQVNLDYMLNYFIHIFNCIFKDSIHYLYIFILTSYYYLLFENLQINLTHNQMEKMAN